MRAGQNQEDIVCHARNYVVWMVWNKGSDGTHVFGIAGIKREPIGFRLPAPEDPHN